MVSWTTVLGLIISFCAGAPDMNKCRVERYACAKRAAAVAPKTEAGDIVNECLLDPKAFAAPVAAPSVKPEKAKAKKS